jgi:hypothetical protein
MYTFIFRFKG